MKKRPRRSDVALMRAALLTHAIACAAVIGASAGATLSIFRMARDAHHVRSVAQKLLEALAES